ncbi:hypothetical protein IJZ97_01575 [bacterium]|nr:hypothetical protein [bacterium]
MGMAAGQARLLSITARLTDNENMGQTLSYAKQRLADETEQLNAAYNEALSATKLTVLTGFNGSEANYTDISYSVMTGYNTVACGRQYVVTNAKGQILVTKELAEAFEAGNGNLNVFLASVDDNGFGYNLCDIDVTNNDECVAAIHEAWDKYYDSVGISFDDEEHDEENPAIEFGYTATGNDPYQGFATYTFDGDTYPINFEGTTKEQRELYDYAVAITEAYYNQGATWKNSVKTPAQDVENSNKITYYTNIFNQMATFGYYTEANEADTIDGVATYKGGQSSTSWFEQQLKEGKLFLKYFSATENDFVQTTLSDDDAIQEVEDERKIALVESQYTQDLAALENKDQKIDLELKKLDTEHNALQTEYDSVKNVIQKNVESSFKTFG